MQLKGKVHEIGATNEVSDKFKKRDLIIEYAENPQYPEFIKFEAQQDKVSLFDKLKVGDQVELFFNLRGRPWTNKEGVTSYFNSIIAWKIDVLSAGSIPAAAAPVDITSAPEEDDLPF